MKITWKTKDNQKDWFYVRKTVFEEEQGFNEEIDEIDERAIHLTLYENNEIVGCTRCFMANDQSWYIGRVALLSAYRSKGYGAILIEKTEEILKDNGVKEVNLHAQCRVQKFYEKSGYNVCGEQFYEQGIAHIHMKKILG